MFGMTIADTTTWLWFFSRAMVVVSEPYDFILDYHHLINYVVSMPFGSTEQLGYSSTITKVAVPLKADPARYCIQGWSIRKFSNPKCTECALKDFWIPLDSQMKSEIQEDIFQRIEPNDPAARENPDLYKQ
ncbi:uncharacterized protein BT62DRAFT_1077910 [Guyanagaster necrorhizus]|uniref:Fungal-type protein kinase domain-containing protein n=1 Tax=Guyanagaster necrorhizus TaxID=856835 RepID=A0A9P7VP16_9AGAR|nr:uncharacterized protein BT62DRAFT_1077910 [Guyanagaster necrorhizus MCA 3950]KAG7444085.1 hypothetical protein BT62DRAFT_1077910 [Guyanagaster necrorhizus MCA 3950]